MRDNVGCALVRIGTRHGVRVEHFPRWACSEDNVVLSRSNGFCDTKKKGVQIRVGGWDADACRASYHVSAARIRRPLQSNLNYDGDNGTSSDDSTTSDSSTEVNYAATMLRKMRLPSKRQIEKKVSLKYPKTKKKCHHKKMMPIIIVSAKNKFSRKNRPKNIELFLTDAEADVFYIWIILFPNESFKRSSVSPHLFSPFTVENCCGSCKELFELDFKLLKAMAMPRHQRGITGGDIVSTLGGTLSLYPDRYQIGFRGTRSMRMLAKDWASVTGISLDQTRVSVYMLVLKGQLGASVLLNGSLDPTSSETHHHNNSNKNDVDETAMAHPYIVNRMQKWCTGTRRNTDVCDSIELKGIRWASLLSSTHFSHHHDYNNNIAAPLEACDSSVSVTRRGGVMMRLVFPSETPWSVELEDQVLLNCNSLLAVLRHAVSGKPMTCFEYQS